MFRVSPPDVAIVTPSSLGCSHIWPTEFQPCEPVAWLRGRHGPCSQIEIRAAGPILRERAVERALQQLWRLVLRGAGQIWCEALKHPRRTRCSEYFLTPVARTRTLRSVTHSRSDILIYSLLLCHAICILSRPFQHPAQHQRRENTVCRWPGQLRPQRDFVEAKTTPGLLATVQNTARPNHGLDRVVWNCSMHRVLRSHAHKPFLEFSLCHPPGKITDGFRPHAGVFSMPGVTECSKSSVQEIPA